MKLCNVINSINNLQYKVRLYLAYMKKRDIMLSAIHSRPTKIAQYRAYLTDVVLMTPLKESIIGELYVYTSDNQTKTDEQVKLADLINQQIDGKEHLLVARQFEEWRKNPRIIMIDGGPIPQDLIENKRAEYQCWVSRGASDARSALSMLEVDPLWKHIRLMRNQTISHVGNTYDEWYEYFNLHLNFLQVAQFADTLARGYAGVALAVESAQYGDLEFDYDELVNRLVFNLQT